MKKVRRKMSYKILWEKLKEKMNYANENAHPRFKMMGERPTIPIVRVIQIMKDMEEKREE